MGKIFMLISQFRNNTHRRIGFRFSPDRQHCPLPNLSPGDTRQVKTSKILKCLLKYGCKLKIRVLVDDRFTEIEIYANILLHYVRVQFRYGEGSDSHVLFVEGALEKTVDYFLRLRGFGFMRNRYWDDRQSFPLPRYIEAPDQHVSSLPATTLHQRDIADDSDSESDSDTANPPTRADDSDSESDSESDSDTANPPTGADDSDSDSDSDTASSDSDSDSDTANPPTRGDGGTTQRPQLAEPQRSMRRKQITANDHSPVRMDGFVHGLLFCFALLLVSFIYH